MTPKVFLGLAVVTVVTVAAATVSAVLQPGPAPVAFVDQPAFPELRANPDAVAKVTIQTKDGTVTLVRSSPETWTAPDRYAYPAASDKVRELIVQLADMRLIEAKTNNAERYERLEVEDLDQDNPKSRLVRLESADGTVLAEALMGKRRFKLTGSQPAGTYLRRVGDGQSWLASGGLELDPEVEAWLDQEIVQIPRDDVASIAFQLAEGAPYTVSRASKDEELAIVGLTETEKVKEDANINQLASALTSVTLSAVKPRDEVTWPAQINKATVTTFKGLVLNVEIALIDDKPWATFTATTNQLPADAAEADAVKQQAEAITDKTRKWAYEVNQSLYQRLTKSRESWLQAADGTS